MPLIWLLGFEPRSVISCGGYQISHRINLSGLTLAYLYARERDRGLAAWWFITSPINQNGEKTPRTPVIIHRRRGLYYNQGFIYPLLQKSVYVLLRVIYHLRLYRRSKMRSVKMRGWDIFLADLTSIYRWTRSLAVWVFLSTGARNSYGNNYAPASQPAKRFLLLLSAPGIED